MKIKHVMYHFWLLIAVSTQTTTAIAEVSTTIDAKTQQQSWLLTMNDGFELKIAQLSPDQAHGFFLARGFPSVIAQDIASHCPMQTVIKNTGNKKNGGAIRVILKEWQLKIMMNNKEKQQGIKLKETWHKEWQEMDVPTVAQLAFRWATFPSEQTFQPNGDYNWGVITMGFPLSSTRSFDLKVMWYHNGIQKSEWIHAINCAENN